MGALALKEFPSSEARMYRPMKSPYRKDAINELLAETDKKFKYEIPVGIRVAPSGDKAFDYGDVGIEITHDGNVRQHKSNYLRVWKKEYGKQWKIVADVVSL